MRHYSLLVASINRFHFMPIHRVNESPLQLSSLPSSPYPVISNLVQIVGTLERFREYNLTPGQGATAVYAIMQPLVYAVVPLYLICYFMILASAHENYLLDFDYHSERFRDWFPDWKGQLENITATSCNESLETYHKLILAKDVPGVDSPAEACKEHISCLLEHFSERDKAVMQSVSVLIGLLPALLSQIGPSAVQLQELAHHRPALAAILLGGAPVLNSLWGTREEFGPSGIPGIERQSKVIAIPISVLQYTFAILAFLNTVTTTISLGNRSVLSWSCEGSPWIFLWLYIPACALTLWVIFRIVRFKISNRLKRTNRAMETRNLRSWKVNEFEICANHGIEDKERVRNSLKLQGLTVYFIGTLVTGVLLSLIQLVMGAAILASLLFITFSDAAKFVLARYIGSAIICRFILMFEISGLRVLPKQQAVDQEQTLLGSADSIEMERRENNTE